MKRLLKNQAGFTVVELIIVIVVIGVLAVISLVVYGNFRQNSVKTTLSNDLIGIADKIDRQMMRNDPVPTTVDDLSIKPSKGVAVSISPSSTTRYDNLSPIQNGVLFHDICLNLINNPKYSTIHAKDGSDSSSVVMSCDDNISSGGLLITGWESKHWPTPITKSQLENYIASVPYDNWWTDKQEVVRSFYGALISRFSDSGGTWPITSFWDPWANEWSGVTMEELPNQDEAQQDIGYCVEAVHSEFPNMKLHVKSSQGKVTEGSCP